MRYSTTLFYLVISQGTKVDNEIYYYEVNDVQIEVNIRYKYIRLWNSRNYWGLFQKPQ